jgi:membrane associated rhomboid family serine protease
MKTSKWDIKIAAFSMSFMFFTLMGIFFQAMLPNNDGLVTKAFGYLLGGLLFVMLTVIIYDFTKRVQRKNRRLGL